MSKLEVLALGIIVVGVLGYLVALVLLVRFRAWMGTRGQGWPRLLLGTLIALTALLGVLYTASLVFMLGMVPTPVRLVWSFFNGIALAVLPWGLVIALARWWRPARR